MYWLKQSTAVTVPLPPLLDSADGDTKETGLTVNAADVLLSKNGAAFAAKNDATAATIDSNTACPRVPLDATDTGTLGHLVVHVHISGALYVEREFMVISADVWNALVGATDNLQVDATQINGDATGASNLATWAQALKTTTVSDATSASQFVLALAYSDKYNGQALLFTSGSLKGEARRIQTASNNGGFLEVVPDRAYSTTPSTSDEVMILPEALYNVVGKVVGLGSATFQADGVQAALDTDAVGANALAADAVAEIQSGLGTSANQTTLLNRLTSARAGYLDNLNVGGNVAASSELPTNFGDMAITATTGKVTVGTNDDKTGYSLADGSISSAKFAAGAIDAAAIATDAIDADALATDAVNEILDAFSVRRNTAQAGASGTITLDASASATNDLYNGTIIQILSGTGAGQARLIYDYVGSTKVASVSPNWTTAPDATSVFRIIPAGVVQDVYNDVDVNMVQTISALSSNTTGAALNRAHAANPDVVALAKNSDMATLLNRITSTLFSGITSLAEWLGLMAGKQTGDNTALSEIRATGAGSGTYDPTADSQEAIRDRGDAAWITGGGGSGTADWTTDEKSQIRKALGVTGTTAATSGAGHIDTLLSRTEAGVEVVSTDTQSGVIISHLHVNNGDDHTNALGNALEWTTSDADTWPDLDGSGVSITFTMDRNADNADATTGTAELSKSGSVITGTGATKKVRVELTDTETGGLDTGVDAYDYQVRATMGDSTKRTLARGTITVHKAPIDD